MYVCTSECVMHMNVGIGVLSVWMNVYMRMSECVSGCNVCPYKWMCLVWICIDVNICEHHVNVCMHLTACESMRMCICLNECVCMYVCGPACRRGKEERSAPSLCLASTFELISNLKVVILFHREEEGCYLLLGRVKSLKAAVLGIPQLLVILHHLGWSVLGSRMQVYSALSCQVSRPPLCDLGSPVPHPEVLRVPCGVRNWNHWAC